MLLNSAGPELAATLGFIPDSFEWDIADDQLSRHMYPVSNDAELAHSYGRAIARLPDIPDATRVGLIVGNGSFETAAQLFPSDVVLIHVDSNPRTLFTLRVVRELITQCATVQEFHAGAQQFDESMRSMYAPVTYESMRQDYLRQQAQWQATDVVEHFLASDEAFNRAKAGLAGRLIAYRFMDLRQPAHLQALAQDLGRVNAQIVLANFTNLFASGYIPADSAVRIGDLLPFHPEAQIMESYVEDVELWSANVDFTKWLDAQRTYVEEMTLRYGRVWGAAHPVGGVDIPDLLI